MPEQDSINNLFSRSSLGWQQKNLKIVNKKSQLVFLVHNIAQLKVHNTLQLQRDARLPQRTIVLKARQEGISTGVSADNFEDTWRRSNRHACVVSADTDSTNKVFNMCNIFYEELPADKKKQLEHSNRKELVYAAPHRSSILCQTAGKDVLGRGGTTHRIHATEVAFWRNADKQMLGLLQEVPKEIDSIADTCVVIESTANGVGGYFHNEYWKAIERLKRNPQDYNGYLPIFLPWYIFPDYRMALSVQMGGQFTLSNDEPYCEVDTVEYYASLGVRLTNEQLYWRRYTIDNDCGGDLSKFKQEYPGTAREAFQSTGRMIFTSGLLDKHEINCRPAIATIEFDKDGKPTNVLRSLDCWKIWKWPQVNHEYIEFGDVCEGLLVNPDDPKSDPDYHYAGILDRNTGELVATFRGRCDTIPYGQQMVKAARFYMMSWASPEVNSCGLAVLNEFKRANYPRIYQRQGKDEEFVEEDTSKLGYKTTVLNRKPGIETLKETLKQQAIIIYDKQIIDECRTFINKNGKPQAETGYHDDAVMMLVGLIQLHLQCPIGNAGIEQSSTTDRPDETKRLEGVAVAGAYDDEINESDIDEWS